MTVGASALILSVISTLVETAAVVPSVLTVIVVL